MGIRVVKCIGYGLTDLAFEKKEYHQTMVDPRINWKKLQKRQEKMYEMGAKSFLTWVKRNWSAILQLEAHEHKISLEKVKEFPQFCPYLLKEFFGRHKHWDLSNCLVHDSEFGLPNVMVLIPPLHAYFGECGWKRYDDTIDWVEETWSYGQSYRVVEPNSCGIWPYDQNMVRFKDPKPGLWSDDNVKQRLINCKVDTDGAPIKIGSADYNMLVGRWSPNMPPTVEGDLLEHLVNDWRPQLPTELLAVMWWMRDCFPDFGVIRDALRPVLYVYWG